jgi:hypothetical protein
MSFRYQEGASDVRTPGDWTDAGRRESFTCPISGAGAKGGRS